MQFLMEPMRSYYIEKYPIESLFSFPITPFIQVCQFERGEFIFKEGSQPDYMFYLVEGKAKLYVTQKNGKVSLLNFLHPPTFMGEIELLNAERYSRGIQTATQVICLAIPIHACKDKLLQDATFLKYLCIFLSKKQTMITSRYAQDQAFPLINRLAAFILLSADNDNYKEKHTEVCEYLGVSYRHLLHVLAQLCESNIIEKQGRGYKIRDKERLQELAKEV
ncbi:transcriptional regulator YeiL [Neobacillus sp. CF12]|uniref:transcriptional regulator YeiL n=1 Tax=Neobacillus sp. CF12 TaxID=3055864 RepID=UPI0025A236F2|nr:transcriptional regulator YeiL [Neobacillus sp. CF12]MDM5326630.1 transcriptional regulator YeiL [Neobacillus sp. CF12]